jgi:lipopolysaccharide export system protein LptC
VKTPRGFGRAWDRLTIYLPVLLMGVLALGTYWLARTTPAFTGGPAALRPEKHEADYFLRGFSVKSFDVTGRLKTEVQGTEARHYPDTDTTEIEQPHIVSYTINGAVIVATARRAISNADGSQVQLIGNAVVIRDAKDPKGQPAPRIELRGEFLDAFMDQERVKSHLPVTIKRGDGDVFTADSMNYSNLDRLMDLSGNVHGTLQPPRSKAAAQ